MGQAVTTAGGNATPPTVRLTGTVIPRTRPGCVTPTRTQPGHIFKGYSMVALFPGPRFWSDRAAIAKAIAELPEGAVVIVGGARGADRLAEQEADRAGLHVAVVRAKWGSFGKAAGYRRNAAMLKLKPDVVYAFPMGGPGTADMVRQSITARVPVYVRGVEE